MWCDLLVLLFSFYCFSYRVNLSVLCFNSQQFYVGKKRQGDELGGGNVVTQEYLREHTWDELSWRERVKHILLNVS